MQPGNGLHGPAIAQIQPLAVDVLEDTDIGIAILGDGNARFAIQSTGHAAGPHDFILQTLLGEAVHLRQMPQQLIHRGVDWRNQLQEGLGIVRGDLGMGECVSQAGRMGRLGDESGWVNPQPFLFNTAKNALEAVHGPGR